jgi:hypothetical protein
LFKLGLFGDGLRYITTQFTMNNVVPFYSLIGGNTNNASRMYIFNGPID